MSLLFTNFKAGILAMIPNILPIAILFGTMGFFDIPLNTGTAMIADIAIGIAVDDTIHLMSRYNLEMKRLNNEVAAIKTTIRAETRPVLITTISLMFGFLILTQSEFIPTIQFGFLSAMVVVAGYFTDALITPVLCANTRLVTLWDMISLNLRDEVIKTSPLFQHLTPWQIRKIVLLAHMRDYKSGEIIVKQGDRERIMYLLLNGSVEVALSKTDGTLKSLDLLTPGQVFGEIALVEEVERTANVISKGDSTVLAIDWNDLNAMRKVHPIVSSKLFLNIARILGRRLAKDNQKQLQLTVNNGVSTQQAGGVS
jgi:uncharacterized protein